LTVLAANAASVGQDPRLGGPAITASSS
jgi:hypothetical protein